ncbi:hypothetical protein GCM10007387_13920 [Pseudoduganella albidiflava]|uniref:Uncharacterized protein n=1 Tax=Pseudoduganella albidiflava TaxID=321983 RepID=A0AA87XQ81_9BURK|nr:hypothetical protein GCM10007387_13920 [Pseudoduganella albidiflava]
MPKEESSSTALASASQSLTCQAVPFLKEIDTIRGLIVRLVTWLASVAAAGFSISQAANLSGDPSGLWKIFPGIYKVHSGSVADRTPPAGRDRKLTVHVDGNAAREIFDSIGPDVQPTCDGGAGNRDRRKKGIYCVYDPADVKAKGGPYRCWIGINLVTGDTETNVDC